MRKRRYPWTPALVERLLAGFDEDGLSPADLALELRVPEYVVRTKLKREGRRLRGPLPTTRACLSCGHDFPSPGPYLRVCTTCKQSGLFSGLAA